MPEIAVLNDKIITPSDIYKFNITKDSPFVCYNCDKPLIYRTLLSPRHLRSQSVFLNKMDYGAMKHLQVSPINTSSEIILPFGKHKGKSYEYIKQTDISYCNWVLTKGKVTGDMKVFQDWLKTVAKNVTCEHCNGTGLGHMM